VLEFESGGGLHGGYVLWEVEGRCKGITRPRVEVVNGIQGAQCLIIMRFRSSVERRNEGSVAEARVESLSYSEAVRQGDVVYQQDKE
jgi:hypothetical protein